LIAQNWAFGIYVAATLAIVFLMLGLSYVLGGRARGRAKNDPFESGVVSPGTGHLRISPKFYLVAVFFLIFDAESTLFLYPWAISVLSAGWAGFIEVCVFVFVLMIGLLYIWRQGGLDWAPLSRTQRTRSLPTLYRDPASAPQPKPQA